MILKENAPDMKFESLRNSPARLNFRLASKIKVGIIADSAHLSAMHTALLLPLVSQPVIMPEQPDAVRRSIVRRDKLLAKMGTHNLL